MADLLHGRPLWIVFGVLFLGAVVRGGATYAVGRGARAGGSRSRFAGRLDAPIVRRAETWVRRFGAPLVALGFLTVGVQSAINAAAGMLRMPMRRFIPGLVVGALLWATLYTTVGLAVVDAALGRVPWWWALIALLVAGATVGGSRLVQRRAALANGRDRG
jgi:membrane protein DedA with SNARE-associated domain